MTAQVVISETDESGSCYKLEPILDIVSAERFYIKIQSMLETSNNITLDASAVTKLTTPIVQIIVAAYKAFQEVGGNLEISNPSNAFIEAFEELGLIGSEVYQNFNS